MALDSLTSFLPNAIPVSLQVIGLTLLFSAVYDYVKRERPHKGFPVIKLEGKSAKKSWLYHGGETVKKGLDQCSGAFQIISGTGPKIILPNHFADEVRNHPDLNFNKSFEKDFFTSYPGFEAHRAGLRNEDFIRDTVRIKLTQSLNLVTDDLVEETADGLHDIFGEDPRWHTVVLREIMLDLIARLSSRVFLGKDLCRNERWLAIAKSYTVDSFVASYLMRCVPSIIRPFLYCVIPQSSRLRKAVRDSRQIIDPEIERRQARVRKALEAGEKPPKVSDTIGWMYEMAKGKKVDFVGGQLSLTMAAIHTTTETTCQALFDLCEHPEIIEPLRKEIIEVITEHGWAKTSLYKMKLMDSFLKESQRVNTISITSMQRWVEKPITLSDGTVLPKGSRILLSTRYSDPTLFPEPHKFVADRFVKLRSEPGQENDWQFVNTNPDYLLFGHGKHACPGRFFASNEIKIALCHLLLKYDWRLLNGEIPKAREFEGTRGVDPEGKVEIRRRQEEISL